MPIPNNIKIIFEDKAIFVMKEYLSKTDYRQIDRDKRVTSAVQQEILFSFGDFLRRQNFAFPPKTM